VYGENEEKIRGKKDQKSLWKKGDQNKKKQRINKSLVYRDNPDNNALKRVQ